MARYNVRCSREKCKARAVFNKHPDAYKVPRKCENCGGTRFRVIANRAKDRNATTCMCGAFIWTGSVGRFECLKHRRGSPGCRYDANGTARERDEFGRTTYSCPHDGLSRWPALYCAETTRPAYSRWHFGWKAATNSRAAQYASVGGCDQDSGDLSRGETVDA